MMEVMSANMEFFDDKSKKQGGRRKQSKPVRVFEKGNNGAGASPAVQTEPGANKTATPEPPAGAGSSSASPTTTSESQEQPMEINEEFIDCGLCGDVFKNPVDLDTHIKKTHSEIAGESENASNFPTKYHQLGMELGREISGVVQPNRPETENNFNAMDCEDSGVITKDPISGEVTNTTGRIFHIDAFCDICQKEFCNKYFLKTHKANKHGIYENGSEAGTPSSSPPQPMPPQQDALPLTSKPETPVKEVPPAPAVPEEKVMPLSQTTPDNKHEKEKKSGKSDMEDYCEFCQKHFCNKYYLRKHKQDVHGLVVDTPPGRRGRPAGTGPLGGPATVATTIPITSGTPIQNLPQPPISSGGVANPISNVMFLNPFMPPVALIQAQPLLQASPATFAQIPGLTTVPASASQQTAAGQPENAVKTINANISTTTTSSNDPKASEPASCDICHKEFCNRYFLNIHKSNKHGIKIDEEPKPESATIPLIKEEKQETLKVKEEDPNIATNAKVAQTVAEIVAQQAQIDQAKNSNQQPPSGNSSDASTPPAGSGGTMFGNMIAARLADRVMCEICNKEVCNKYFLKTHKMKVHGILPTAQEQADRRKADFREQQQQQQQPSVKTTPFVPQPENLDNVSRPKDDELLKMGIDPEAYCEICKKEFCSKYFLKTHKLNIHGIKIDSPGTPSKPERPPSMTMNIKQEPKALDFMLANMPPIMSMPHGMPQLPPSSVAVPPAVSMPPVSLPSVSMPPLSVPPKSMPSVPMSLPPPPAAVVPPLNVVPTSLNLTPSNLNIISTPVNPNNPDTPVRTTWKWKEPSASQRVTCELCNKELCNKYFLRTHKMNKHGIYEEGSSPGPKSQNGSPKQPSTPVSMEERSCSSMEGDSVGGNQMEFHSIATTSVHDQVMMAMAHSQGLGQSVKQENGFTEALIHRCDVCGMIFGEQMTLNLHMVQDHPGMVTVKTKSFELPKLERSSEPANAKNLTSRTGMGIRRKYLLKLRQKLLQRANKQNGAEIMKTPRSLKFQCVYCKKKFSNRLRCKGHIRNFHKKLRFTGTNTTESRKYVAYATPTESKQDCTLQPFMVKVADTSNGSSLVPCMVTLPVHQQINEPCTLMLSLTPVKP